MPSPDLSDLHDLVLFDQSPADLVDRAELDAAVKMPDLVIEKGDTGRVLMESLALIVAELGYAINRVPNGMLDVLLRLYGITRSVGTAPTVQVTLSSTTGNNLSIPAGTVVRLVLAGRDPLDFTTDSAGAGPGPTLTIPATAAIPTAGYNGTAIGTPLEVITPLPDIDSAATASVVGGGTDPEDTPTWRDRAIQRLTRLTTTLVVPQHFTAQALEIPGVYRALTLDNNNAGTTAAGHVTVAVLGPGGTPLSGPAKTSLQALLQAEAQVNLAVHVIDPTTTAVAVNASVHPLPGFTSADMTANVTAALAAYLSADTWDWSGTVRRNKLIQVIENATGVDYLISLTTPAADVSLTGTAPLAALGTVTVTTA